MVVLMTERPAGQKEPLDFIDAGAGDDEPVKGICQGHIRQWHDEFVNGARAYVERAIASYANDPADNQFQKGFLAALEVVRDEAFAGRGQESPLCVAKAYGGEWCAHRCIDPKDCSARPRPTDGK
jgi:hypothetical protein